MIVLGGTGMLFGWFHPYLMAHSRCRPGELHGYHPPTGTPQLVRKRLVGHQIPSNDPKFRWAAVCSVVWSPDGRHLAISGINGYGVRLWNVATGKQEQALDTGKQEQVPDGHEGWVDAVAWNPDGTRLASTGDHYTVRLWSAREGRHLRTLCEPRVLRWPGCLRSVGWSPNGRWIAGAPMTSSYPQGIQIWDARSGREVAWVAHTVDSLAWSPDGKRLASVDGKAVQVWDVPSWAKLGTLNDPGV
jgi:WD40 repeat protein